jgi:hypothetical protein
VRYAWSMAKKHGTESTGTYHFRQAGGIISVVNSDGYLMAEYNGRTGKVSWQRVLPITQRESIEKWLQQQYPV